MLVGGPLQQLQHFGYDTLDGDRSSIGGRTAAESENPVHKGLGALSGKASRRRFTGHAARACDNYHFSVDVIGHDFSLHCARHSILQPTTAQFRASSGNGRELEVHVKG
jgi:hypothetical protein